MRTTLIALSLLVVVGTTPAWAQPRMRPLPRAEVIELAGPRVGLTTLTPGIVERLAELDIIVTPVISQFGWQLEKQFLVKQGGLTPVTELVLLVGGVDQGVAIPSASWLFGLRTRNGAEFGIGPNITPAGTSLVLAGGVTMRMGAFNVPMNFAVIPSEHGLRVTVLTGFSVRRR